MTPAVKRATSRAELLEALTVERFGTPVPEYQPTPVPAGREDPDEVVLRRTALDLATVHDDDTDLDDTSGNTDPDDEVQALPGPASGEVAA